jgi:hypothetical protein
MSRNSVDLTGEKIENISRPRNVLVTTINSDLGPTVKRDLKNLSIHQNQNPRIEEIRQKLSKTVITTSTSRYKIENGILYCYDYKFYKYWGPYLTHSLEDS